MMVDWKGNIMPKYKISVPGFVTFHTTVEGENEEDALMTAAIYQPYLCAHCNREIELDDWDWVDATIVVAEEGDDD